jgi:hypothetical protein
MIVSQFLMRKCAKSSICSFWKFLRRNKIPTRVVQIFCQLKKMAFMAAQNPVVLDIDPLNMTGVLPLMASTSKNKYLTTWRAFVAHSDLLAGMMPTEEMVQSYIDKRRIIDGLCANTLWCEYSHINKILKQKYHIQLQVKYLCIFHPF